MKTIDIEIAVMKYCNIRQNIIVPNISWGIVDRGGCLHEIDICVLTKSNYATEIEIKTSKADLIADKKKLHGHYHRLIKYLYFAVPEELKEIALIEIPIRAGLYVIKEYKGENHVLKIRPASVNRNAVPWTDHQRQKLSELGTMRILGLKEKISNSLKRIA